MVMYICSNLLVSLSCNPIIETELVANVMPTHIWEWRIINCDIFVVQRHNSVAMF